MKVTIAQITDSHIVPKGQHWYDPESKVDERLKKVCSQLNELKPDVVIATGDLVEVKEAYSYFREITDVLTMPMYVIPGNHDDREGLRQAFADKDYMPKSGFIQYIIDDYPVRLIGLDTHVPGGIPHGELDKERLDWLEETLASNIEKPTLIFMHHFPFKVGHPIFDKIICFAEQRFEEIIKNADNVIGMVAGHYHQQASSMFGGKPFFIAPSTAPAHKFSPEGTEVVAIELKDPAVTYHSWQEGQAHVTSIVNYIVDETVGWGQCYYQCGD